MESFLCSKRKKNQHQKWKANFANENRDDLTKSFEHFLSSEQNLNLTR